LTAKQRKLLRGLAHPLEPVVRVGKGGLTPAVVAEARRSLQAHELIKVRIEAESANRKELAEQLANQTGAEVAGTIGKVAILYRAREEDPKIDIAE